LGVQGVDPGSRAEAAQIESGEVLAAFDGVRVASAGDLIPPAAEREATVGVRHAGSATELPRTLVVEGFRRAPPTDLLAAALIVLVALLAVLLFAVPTPAGLSSSIQRIVLRVRARAFRRSAAPLSPWGTLGVVLVSVARECVPSSGLPALVDALLCSVFAVLPFGQYLVASQLDVGLLFVAAATSLAASALLASGTPLRGIQAAAYVLWQHVPAAAAVATVVLTTGSLRVQEVERAQGGWPWDWLAFRHPAALVALVFLLASGSMAFSGPPARGLSALVEDDHSASLARRGIWLEIASRAHRLIVAGLASVLFLGGWLLPGVPPATQDARPWLELVGAGVLLAKTGVIVLMLAAAGAFGARLPLGARAKETLFLRVPVALVALGTTAAWSWWGPRGAAQTLVSCGLVAAVTLTALAVGQRLKQGVGAPEARLSPFL
jgi:NADH-quinone oxidoreductase subunit H